MAKRVGNSGCTHHREIVCVSEISGPVKEEVQSMYRSPFNKSLALFLSFLFYKEDFSRCKKYERLCPWMGYLLCLTSGTDLVDRPWGSA